MSPPAPSTAPPPAPPVVRRDFLERLSRALLLRLLAPHESPLAAHAFSVSALRAAPDDDRAPVHALFDLFDPDSAGASDPALLPLLTLLSNLCRVGTRSGREALIKLDRAHVLPKGLGAEDLAATVALDHPSIFAKMKLGAVTGDSIRGFVHFQARADRDPQFEQEHIERTRQLLAEWFAGQHRTKACEIHVKRRGPEIHFEIGHGKMPQTHDLIDESLARKIVTQISIDRSYAFYNTETRLLAVHALEFIKKGLRTCFGAGCGGDEEFFTHAEALLDLTPLRDLNEALAADASLGVTDVALREIEIMFDDGTTVLYASPRQDLRGSLRRPAIDLSSREEGARVRYLKIAVTIAGAKRPLLVTLNADRNQLDYDRRDARVDAIFLAWLAARGIWLGTRRVSTVPAPLEGEGDEAPASAATA